MYRPLMQPKLRKALAQPVSPGLHVLATGGLRTGQTPPAALLDVPALIAALQAEGWAVTEIDGVVTMSANGNDYQRTLLQLIWCDFSNLPGALVNDLRDALQQQGRCGG